MRIATFNVQNLRLRPDEAGPRLDGARDGDDEDAPAPAAERALDPADRRLTAAVIAGMDADVVALQEVFDAATLDHFHDEALLAAGAAPYPFRVCLPGNDGRGQDVALMSRRALSDVRSHAALRPADLGLAPPPGIDPELPVFRRDCLEARAGALTLFVCHFKAPWPDAAAAWPVRRLEAEAVRRIIAARFPDPAAALWLVLGDLNDPAPPATPGAEEGPDTRAIAPLTRGFAVDLGRRAPGADRWSYHEPGTGRYSRPDMMLASPALAARFPGAVPRIVREGMGRAAHRYPGPHLPGVGHHRPRASDHAALCVDFEGL